MKRSWLASLLAAPLLLAQAASCTTQQDLGDRPNDDGGPPGSDGGDSGNGSQPPAPMRVFVTKSLYDGDLRTAARRLSGLEAADALCQLSADGAVLGGHWVAWLSDRNMDAIERVDNDGPWVSLPRSTYGSRKIFLDRAGIGAGPIEDTFSDEYGESYSSSYDYYRTGSSPSGRSTGEDCLSWSNNNTTGGNAECGRRKLLCLEQKVAGYRKRVFVTSKTFTGDFAYGSSVVEAADGLCGDAAKAANLGGKWRAWISSYSSGTYRAFDRLGSRTDSWTLVDGSTVVFSSREKLSAGGEHAIDRDEFNHPVDASSLVWTATKAQGATSVDTCSDFRTKSSGNYALVGIAGETSPKWTESQTTLTCDKAARLYCFEL
ncbi:hypothetical protein LZC95_52815 [Pendulispora brunnea]|uniref:DUF1554 domain-containing protein n=1 Tax=Pendulispora brunnea TaxID=2905690 RepID=A0ABZ2KCM9_9BACT